MNTSILAAFAATCLLLTGSVRAGLLPPVDPILNGTNHVNEDHSGHDHGSFSGVDATGASFNGALLRNSTFSNDIFVNADLRNVNFDDTVFFQSDLRGASFVGSQLSELTLENSDLRGTIFRDGPRTLLGAFVINSDLRGQDFSGLELFVAAMQFSDLRGVNLRGANLRNPHAPAEQQGFDLAIYDATTIYDSQTVFPIGFDPVAHGLTLVPEPSSWLLAAIGVGVLLASRRFRRR